MQQTLLVSGPVQRDGSQEAVVTEPPVRKGLVTDCPGQGGSEGGVGRPEDET